MFKVYHGISNKTPVTKPIADEEKAQLAFNMLYSMGDSGCIVSVDGCQEKLLPDSLSIADEGGNTIDRHMDHEWYLGGKEAAREAGIEALIKAYKEDGTDLWRETAEEIVEQYTALSYDDNKMRQWFLPKTYSYNKAENMAAIVKFGMADNVEFYTAENEKINIRNTFIANEDGEYLDDPEMPAYIEDGLSFEDAVESLSIDAPAMEQ